MIFDPFEEIYQGMKIRENLKKAEQDRIANRIIRNRKQQKHTTDSVNRQKIAPFSGSKCDSCPREPRPRPSIAS